MTEPYQTHPQLQRTESHNWRLCNSALQTAHALIHISFSANCIRWHLPKVFVPEA